MTPAVGSKSTIDRCFLCDRTSDRVVWRENGIDGRLCECGLLYSDTGGRPPSRRELMNDLHPESFYAMPARYKARWMASRCPKGKLLEVGCGEGSFLKEARTLGYEVAGMEPDAERAQRVSQQLGIPVERAFIEDDSLPPGGFDVVYHCDLLAHFVDPLRALSSMTRLLRPGGVLCFEAGILGGISPFWYRLIGSIDLGPHLFLYSFRALANLMDRAGLAVEHQTNFGLAPQVLLHRPLDILVRRGVGPLLSVAKRLAGGGGDDAERIGQAWENVLRYPVGRLAPRLGPATVLIVAGMRAGR